MQVSIEIARPPRAVFEFSATPRHWAHWHPGFVEVSGVVDRPPAVGDKVIEKISLNGRGSRLAPHLTADIAWEITARKVPEHWAMAVRVPRRGKAAIGFFLEENGKGTLLECEIEYEGVSRLIDLLRVRSLVRSEAADSLARLKKALESRPRARRRR